MSLSRPRWIESLEGRRLLSTVFASVGSQPAGPLTGKIVYTSAGHGLTDNGSGFWRTGRGLTNGIVEDLGNYDQMTSYAEHLWRAGATVVPMRPIGHQTSEVIVDNIDATYTGTWNDSTGTPYYSTSNGEGVHYRYATGSTTLTAAAKFTPNLPKTDFYPVYTWVRDGSDRAADSTYRVNHTGGSTDVKVDHSRVGKGWVYLGTYRFTAGRFGSVEILNRTQAGNAKVVIADAIRFGNGMGDIAPSGKTSGESREDEAAIYWIESSAGWTDVNTRVSYTNWRTSLSSDDDTANVSAPLRWARYLNNAPFGQSVYLSFHSNAGGGRGADGLYNRNDLFPGTGTTNQFRWAQLVGKEITDDMTAYGSPPLPASWSYTANPTFARSDYAFGEIRADVAGNEFDATIIEVAFHDDAADASLLKDPKTRDRAAQSSVQATIRYFSEFGGSSIAFAPDAPTNVRTSVDATGNVTIRWDAPPASTIFGGTPSGYRVYASRDGYGFDGGAVGNLATRSIAIPAAQMGAGTVYFKVVATNAGGESPASAVVAARIGDARLGRMLIVDGYDRLGEAQNVVQPLAFNGTNEEGPNSSVQNVQRVRPRWSNSFDYAVQHAQAIANVPGSLGVDTADNAAIVSGAVDLSAYRAVVWILGEESTADRTFDATEQSRVTTYLNAGGKLFVSGAEIGWDLSAQNNGKTFFNNTLRANYVSDDANTYAAAGVANSIFAGVSLTFDNGENVYNVDYPDRLSPGTGGTSLLTYTGGNGGNAAVGWSSGNGATKTIVMGFPFETILDAAQRTRIMRAALSWFGMGTPLPATLSPSTTPLNPGTILSPVLPVAPTTATVADSRTRSRSSVAGDVFGSSSILLA